MKHLQALGITEDHSQMLQSVQEVIDTVGWLDKNQISLSSRVQDSDPYHDGCGKSYDHKTQKKLIHESDFTVLNPMPEYLRNSLITLREKTQSVFGRIRLMRLMPHYGLSVHRDFETRFHYVIETNLKSYFGFSQFSDPEVAAAECWHIPADHQWYHLDTTRDHFVYNGGETPRIHIVISVIKTALARP